MKASKLRRKQLNALRQQSDVPWPARKYTVAPTFSDSVAKEILVGQCSRKVAEQQIESKTRLKRKKTETVDIACGGNVYVKRGSLGKRRVFCEACRARKQQSALAHRLQKRVARLTPQQQAAEERKETSKLKRMLRRGAK